MMRATLLALAALMLAACSAPQRRPGTDAQTAMLDPQRLVVVTVANPVTAGMHGAASTWRGWDLGGGYDTGADVQGAVEELSARYDLAPVDGWPIQLLGVHCVVFRLQGDEPREALLRRLSDDPRVESAQPLHEFSTATRADKATPRELQYSLRTMDLEPAHRWSQGRGVRVAVIDTGLDWRHPQLSGRVARQLDLVGSRARVETERHGTAVAGVIAAGANDTGGILGVAPQAELLALKACWPVSEGAAAARCNSFTLARALAAAVELEADVLNLSLAGPADPLLGRLVGAAVDRGMLVVGALPDAGAAQSDSFPAAVAGVIAVRPLGPAGGRGLRAPGQDVITLAPDAGYQMQSGSSLAAAHVSGVAALLRELEPELRANELERLLMESSSRAVDAPAGEAPGVNACAALRALRGAQTCPAGG